ncbi:hypothetical protein ACH436_05560 [Isoptericola sp. NPDC019693]
MSGTRVPILTASEPRRVRRRPACTPRDRVQLVIAAYESGLAGRTS